MLVAQAMVRGVLSAAEITVRRNPFDDGARDLVRRLREIDRAALAGEISWAEARDLAEWEASHDPQGERYALTDAGDAKAAAPALHLDAVRAFTAVDPGSEDYVCVVCDEKVWGDGVCAASSPSTPGCPAIQWRRARHRALTASVA